MTSDKTRPAAALDIPVGNQAKNYEQLVAQVRQLYGSVIVHRSFDLSEPSLYVTETRRCYTGEQAICSELRSSSR